jgi:kynurenine formamidase
VGSRRDVDRLAVTLAGAGTTSGAGEPGYDALPVLDALGLPHAWHALERDAGTLSRITPATVRAACAQVIDGVVLGLNLPLNEPDPPLFGRRPLRHEIFTVDRNTLDDRLDDFYPQASSQWDGLRHVRAREHGFFSGVTDGFEPGSGPLGIDAWSDGIVTRGVLLDIVGLRERQRRGYDPLAGEMIDADDLRNAAADQGVELARGDVLIVRTGWIAAYRRLAPDARVAMAQRVTASGLAGSEDVARFLWDAELAAIAADNPALEQTPGDPAVGSLHRRLIPMLGFVIGELLDVERLAELSRGDGRWEFLFVAVPLNLPGGIGSPANAVAIR